MRMLKGHFIGEGTVLESTMITQIFLMYEPDTRNQIFDALKYTVELGKAARFMLNELMFHEQVRTCRPEKMESSLTRFVDENWQGVFNGSFLAPNWTNHP